MTHKKIVIITLLFATLSIYQTPSYAEEKKTSILDLFNISRDSKSFSPTMNLGGYMQTKFLADNGKDAKSSEFKIMRARLKLFGDFNKYISYNFMLGALEPPPAEEPKAEVVNAIIDIKLYPYANIRIGQFFIPFGYEAPKVITSNDMTERSDLTAFMNSYAIFRDIGVMFFGDAGKLKYKLSLTNGTGANKKDDNGKKDLMATLQYSPIDDLMVGMSGHLGNFGETSQRYFNRKRWNAHIKYTPGKLTLISEFTHREEEQDPNKKDFTLVRSNGFYAMAGYHIFDDFQTVVRYTWFDRNLDGEGDIRKDVAFGINYFYNEHVRVALNYEIRDEEKNPNVGNLFTLMIQGSYSKLLN